MKGKVLALAGMFGASLAVACFSDKPDDVTDPGNIPAYVSCSAGAPAPPSSARVVRIRNFSFESTVTAPRGTTVWWINCDEVAHTSTSDTGVWDSGDLVGGAAYSRVFNTAGSFEYYCTPHPFMRSVVTVQ